MPPFDRMTSSVQIPSTGPKQIVKPKGTCYHTHSLSPEYSTHPCSSSSTLFHEYLMNADGALGDAVVLLQGLRVHAVSSMGSSQAMVKGSISLAKSPPQ